MNAPLYTLDVLRLAGSLPEPIDLERIDGSATERSPTCGSTVSCSVQLDGKGRVQALSQTVEACAFGQASAAVVAQQSTGRGRDEIAEALDQLQAWLAGDRDDPPEWPGLAALGPARAKRSRHGAILLAWRALLAAMDSARR